MTLYDRIKAEGHVIAPYSPRVQPGANEVLEAGLTLAAQDVAKAVGTARMIRADVRQYQQIRRYRF